MILLMDVRRAPETPFISPGVYNFSADPQGGYFLRKAAQANVPIITLFVNSAPPFFTSNNRSCGGTVVNTTIQGYSQYIADVVNYWRTQSVKITHISPMNEPDSVSLGFSIVHPSGKQLRNRGLIMAHQRRVDKKG